MYIMYKRAKLYNLFVLCPYFVFNVLDCFGLGKKVCKMHIFMYVLSEVFFMNKFADH